MSDETSAGVHFPADDQGRRSTTTTTRGVLADSVRGVDAALAERIDGARDWRKDYVDLVHAVTAASAGSPDRASRIATDGLASMRRRPLEPPTRCALPGRTSRGPTQPGARLLAAPRTANHSPMCGRGPGRWPGSRIR